MGLERMLKGAMTNKYVLYVVLFIAITNIVGYLASQDYDSLVFFVITGFLTSYFSDNMTVILLAALVVSNVFLASRTVREGFDEQVKGAKDNNKKKKKNGGTDDDVADDESDESDDESNTSDDDEAGQEAGPELFVGAKLKPGDKEKLKNKKNKKKKKKKEKYSGIQKLSPAAIGEDIDVNATNDANFGEVESQLSASDMGNLNGQTKNLKNAQSDLHQQIKAMGPLMDSAQKMMGQMGGVENLSGMLDQANTMMGSMGPMMNQLTGMGKKQKVLEGAADVVKPVGS